MTPLTAEMRAYIRPRVQTAFIGSLLKRSPGLSPQHVECLLRQAESTGKLEPFYQNAVWGRNYARSLFPV